MSAIWGIISTNNTHTLTKKDAESIQKIYEEKCQLDAYESIQTNHVLFGFGLQKITSFHEDESLPVYDSAKGLYFTADCILDNRMELIQKLMDVANIQSTFNNSSSYYHSLSDGKLLYTAYLLLGDDFVSYVRGLFSIAIWNERSKTLSLYSDHASQRCLYYTVQKDSIMFSTLLAPIKHYYPDLSENEAYDKDFLLCPKTNIYVVPGETPFQDVFLIKPSRMITIQKTDVFIKGSFNNQKDSCSIKEKRYTTILPEVSFHDWFDPSKVIHHFMNLYQKSIQDACHTSGEVGISVSSGLDSSSIAAIASMYLSESEKNLFAYTFTAPAELKAHTVFGHSKNNVSYEHLDETDLVADISSMYDNMKVTNLNPSNKGFLDGLEECIRILEMPIKSLPIEWLLHLIISAKKEGCKVILDGSFGNTSTSYGYPHHIFYDLYKSGRTKEFEQYLYAYCAHQNHPYKETYEMLKTDFDKQINHHSKQEFVPDNVFVCPAILTDYCLSARFSLDQNASMAHQFIDHKDYLSFLDAETLMIYLGVTNTKLGLATNTILRDPTCDVRMLHFCANVPYHYFAYEGVSRWFIRYGFKDLLPASILDDYELHRGIFGNWIYQLKKEWDKTFPKIKQELEHFPHPDWIFTNHLKDYLDTVNCNNPATTKWLVHIYALLSITLFRNIR